MSSIDFLVLVLLVVLRGGGDGILVAYGAVYELEN